MKKIFSLFIAFTLLAFVASPALAEKPEAKDKGAKFYDWNLSGAVMPSPPCGLHDMPGSDTASKLIVNQPNGKTSVTMTGVMKGLLPNTIYTVYPAKAWSTSEKWNFEGNWELMFVLGGNYDHQMTITSQDMYTGAFSGTGFSHTDGSTWDIQGTSKVNGDTITLDLIYTGKNPGYTVHAVGNIGADGSITSGTWTSSGNQSGSWSSLSGKAEKEKVGSGFPGYFGSLKYFTFTTDEFGSGSWHINLTNEDLSNPNNSLSVWINGGGATVLISENFDIVEN